MDLLNRFVGTTNFLTHISSEICHTQGSYHKPYILQHCFNVLCWKNGTIPQNLLIRHKHICRRPRKKAMDTQINTVKCGSEKGVLYRTTGVADHWLTSISYSTSPLVTLESLYKTFEFLDGTFHVEWEDEWDSLRGQDQTRTVSRLSSYRPGEWTNYCHFCFLVRGRQG